MVGMPAEYRIDPYAMPNPVNSAPNHSGMRFVPYQPTAIQIGKIKPAGKKNADLPMPSGIQLTSEESAGCFPLSCRMIASK